MKKNKLLENTIMLYILIFSNYFFNFVTIPYQTRVLGPEIYGKIGFALAFATYFKLFFDFGFILSATEEVSKNRNDIKKLSKILNSVNCLKSIFIIIGLFIMLIIIIFVSPFKYNKLLFFLYFLYVAIDAFQPDFLYRGTENMKIITIRNVIIKMFFTFMILIFLKNKTQYLLVPIFTICGSLFSLIAIYANIINKMKIKLQMVGLNDIKNTFNSSKIYFLSRIASTIYGATNTFILGIIYPVGNTLGYYTSSEKILVAGRAVVTPISDSVYPYMVKNNDFKLIKKLLLFLMPIITIGCIICFIFAEQICVFAFGKEYLGSAVVLRYMIPLIFMALPSYLLGFPTMSPLGLKKEANLTVIYGSIYQLFGIFILIILKLLNLNSLCILTITTELLILILRICLIIKNRNSITKV